MRTRRLLPPEEKLAELLPDVTRKCGKPVRYISAADKRAMEKLIASLPRPAERLAA